MINFSILQRWYLKIVVTELTVQSERRFRISLYTWGEKWDKTIDNRYVAWTRRNQSYWHATIYTHIYAAFMEADYIQTFAHVGEQTKPRNYCLQKWHHNQQRTDIQFCACDSNLSISRGNSSIITMANATH